MHYFPFTLNGHVQWGDCGEQPGKYCSSQLADVVLHASFRFHRIGGGHLGLLFTGLLSQPE